MVAIWIIIAVLFLALELHHMAFFAVFVAAGAGGGAIVAAIAPSQHVLQIAVAIAVATIGVLAVRPYVSRAFARHGAASVVHGVHGGLVGAEVLTLDEIATHTPGHIRLLGETWLAVTKDGTTIAPGVLVHVTDIAGTTLTVKPVATEETS